MVTQGQCCNMYTVMAVLDSECLFQGKGCSLRAQIADKRYDISCSHICCHSNRVFGDGDLSRQSVWTKL